MDTVSLQKQFTQLSPLLGPDAKILITKDSILVLDLRFDPYRSRMRVFITPNEIVNFVFSSERYRDLQFVTLDTRSLSTWDDKFNPDPLGRRRSLSVLSFQCNEELPELLIEISCLLCNNSVPIGRKIKLPSGVFQKYQQIQVGLD